MVGSTRLKHSPVHVLARGTAPQSSQSAGPKPVRVESTVGTINRATPTRYAPSEGDLTELTVDLSSGINGGVRSIEASARATRSPKGQLHRAHSRTGHNLYERNQLWVATPESPFGCVGKPTRQKLLRVSRRVEPVQPTGRNYEESPSGCVDKPSGRNYKVAPGEIAHTTCLLGSTTELTVHRVSQLWYPAGRNTRRNTQPLLETQGGKQGGRNLK